MELIVSEKEIAAKRVAEILSDKSAKVRKINKINVYEWDGAKCMGLSGHVVGVDFPKNYVPDSINKRICLTMETRARTKQKHTAKKKRVREQLPQNGQNPAKKHTQM